MKKNVSLIGISVMLMLIAGCNKDKNDPDFTLINQEIIKTEKALELSLAYNDSLIIVVDSAANPYQNPSCLKYDSLYHSSDSMFNYHYSLFGDEMYMNGIMMQHYTPSNGMMGSGMMNNQEMMSDTAIMNSYYRSMDHLRFIHKDYHNMIFNL